MIIREGKARVLGDDLFFHLPPIWRTAMPQPMHSPRRLRQKLARVVRGGERGR